MAVKLALCSIQRILSTKSLIPSVNIRQISFGRILRAGERRYTKQHEWIHLENSIGTVGITSYAQEALGDVVYVELPDAGTNVNAGGSVGAVESVKAASDIYSPVSGSIIERNLDVENDPSLINKSPHDKGWLFKLKLSDKSEFVKLMNESSYKVFTESEAERDH